MMRKSWLVGGMAGLILSGIVLGAAWTALEEKAGVETGVQYVSSLPLFVTMKVWPKAPEIFIAAIFLFYWVVLGSLAGFVLKKGISWKIAALFVVIILSVLHLKTKAVLENELASSARAFGNFFLELELLRQGRDRKSKSLNS